MDMGADDARQSLADRQREHDALMAAGLEQSARAFQVRRELHESGRKQRSHALSHPALLTARPGRMYKGGKGSLLPSKVAVALEVCF